MPLPQIQALLFDVFGTVVDWRSTIIAEGQSLARHHGVTHVDWAEFADAWRAGYQPAMQQVRDGTLGWTSIDDLHRLILDELLVRFGIQGLSETEVRHFNQVWHRLYPWPDAPGGLLRLKSRYIIATLSNGNVGLLTRMAKWAGLPWDCILSAELARHYKPDPESYLTAARLLNLAPGECMMVAAHNGDLQAAAAQGMATAFVPRPTEYGPGQQADLEPAAGVTLMARDFHELADRLSA